MRKLNASIVIGLIVAIVGAMAVFAYGRNVDRRLVKGQQPTSVLVADSTLSAGSTVDDVRGHVHVAQVPAAFVVADALHSLSDVPAGNVLTSVIAEGGQLSRASFSDPATAGRLRPAIGHVALAIQTDLSPGVARYLSPGQLVDVFVTYHDVTTDGKPSYASNRTKLFVSGVKVLAVNIAQAQTQTKSSHSTFGAASEQSQLQDKVIAVLDLRPIDAERLVNADILGSVYLGYTVAGEDHTATGVTPDDVVRSNR